MILDFNTAARQQVARPSYGDPAMEFMRHIQRQGFESPGEISASGKIVRFGQKKECWYVFHDDSIPAGAFGSWRDGDQSFSWSAKSELEMSPSELHAYRAQMDRIRYERSEALERARAAAAIKAEQDWAKSEPLVSHPYLTAKNVQAHGVKLLNGKVFIPAFGIDGKITTYQTIDSSGKKSFLTDGRKKGSFFTLPGSETVAIAEGYSTAATVHEATGWTVLVAFDAGNMIEVAKEYRAAHPEARMVICGDNDIKPGEKNTGREAAERAGAEVSAKVLIPERDGQKVDWNDLGLDEARRQLMAANSYKVDITKWGLDRYVGKAPEREWLVDNVLPRGECIVLAAMGGVGKGMLTLDLALKVGTPPGQRGFLDFTERTAFGNRVSGHGPVVIFTAEDTRDEIHRRIEAIGMGAARDVFIIPLPDATGPLPLIVSSRLGPEVTPMWREIHDQIMDIKPALVNFDPMASFVMADINKDPAVGAFTMGLFAHLAQKSRATVLVAHHLAKMKDGITTVDNARAAIRGTSAIVDNSRGAYVLWNASPQKAEADCRRLGVPYSRNKVVLGALVKNNFPGDSDIKTFVRQQNGLLCCADDKLAASARSHRPHMLQDMEEAIKEWASKGQPFSKCKDNGVYARRNDLPPSLRDESKHDLESLVSELERQGRIVRCIPVGSSSKNRYDVPSGPISNGSTKIAPGSGK